MTWQNPLVKQVILDVPLVEVTPVTWKGRLTLAECWRKQWRGAPERTPCVQIRDVETNKVLATTFEGHSLASAFVWQQTFYLFGARRQQEAEKTTWNDVWLTWSKDLAEWTSPTIAIAQSHGEHCFNQSVCHNGARFVMAYETDDFVPFTIKFAESCDLLQWRKIPEAVFAPDRYAACPAIRFTAG